MKTPLATTIAATCLALAGIALPSGHAAVGLVDFDPPTTLQGPSIFAPPPPVYVVNGPPLPVTLPPVTVTYTEPDTIDEHGHKQKGKTKTLRNQVIDDGDDHNDAKGHFQDLPSPVPESSMVALMLMGLAALAQVSLRRRRQGSAR